MKIINRKITAVITGAVILIFFLLSGGGAVNASAASVNDKYTGALNDLIKAEGFNTAKYPVNEKDYSIAVIQIAESSDGELFIYTYQPSGQSGNLRASSITIARELDNSINLTPRNYGLTLLNSAGVFYKYRVDNFTLYTSALRYYNISNILRPWDKYLDGAASSGNTIQEVPNKVGQLWTACTVGGTVTYNCADSEVVEITQKLVGYVNYDDGTQLGWGIASNATSAHFVAFDTDRRIDILKSATLEFKERGVSAKICGNVTHVWHSLNKPYDQQYSEPVKQEKTLEYTQVASNAGGGNIQPANKYTWNRIQTSSEFLADKINADFHLTNNAAGELAKMKWVLNFYETPVMYKANNIWLPLIQFYTLPFVGDINVKYMDISDVMILRLEFETDGKSYNLGVVDNKQTGGNMGGNGTRGEIPVGVWILIGAAVIVLTILLCVFIPNFGGFLITIFKGAVTGVGWLISRPFKAINAASEHTKRKRDEAAATKARQQREAKASLKRSKARKKHRRRKAKVKPVTSPEQPAGANVQKPKKRKSTRRRKK